MVRLLKLLRILELLASRLKLLLAAVDWLGGAPTVGLAMTELAATVTVALKLRLNGALVAVETATSATAVATSATKTTASASVPVGTSSAVLNVATFAAVSATTSTALWWE